MSVFAASKQEVTEVAEKKMLIHLGTADSLINPLYISLKKFGGLFQDEFGDKVTGFSLEMAQENRKKIYDEFEKKAQITYLIKEQRAKFKEKTDLAQQIVIKNVGQDL